MILLPFALSRRSSSSNERCSVKKAVLGTWSRWIWTNSEIVVKGRWNQKQKKKVFITITMANSSLIYTLLFVFCFYLLISSCLKKESYLPWLQVILCMLFFLINHFLKRKIFWHLSPYYGGGGLASVKQN